MHRLCDLCFAGCVMLKLVICLLAAGALAVGVLQLRQQRRELAYRCGRLTDQISVVQIKLWNQQLQIATATAPNAIEQTVGTYDLELVPSNPRLSPSDEHPDAE